MAYGQVSRAGRRAGMMLLSTVACSALALIAAPAHAQGGAPEPEPAAIQDGAQADDAPRAGRETGEIVVTATRRADTIGRVPLSIAAVTNDMLNRKGMTSIGDIGRDVAGLVVGPAATVGAAGVGSTNPGTAAFTIRGIQSAAGTPTVGAYLNDTTLQKRGLSAIAAGNGTPVPALFDIERVEVLRGPQGTLYGGSSEGGTVRFITPSPDLDDVKIYAKGEVSTVRYGGTSYLAGVAVNLPLVEDRLGLRVAVYQQHDAGWVDRVDPFNIATVTGKDINSSDQRSVHATLRWQPTPDTTIDASVYASRAEKDDSDLINLRSDAVTNIAARCFAYPGRPAQSGTVPTATCGSPTVTFTRSARSFGPYPFKPNQTFAPGPATFESTLTLPSLSVEHVMPWAVVRSITSGIFDGTKSSSRDTTQVAENQSLNSFLLPEIPNWYGTLTGDNKRRGFSQEVRISSPDADRPISFVVGAYYSRSKTTLHALSLGLIDELSMALFGLTSAQRYGEVITDPAQGTVGSIIPLPVINNIFAQRDLVAKDTELAGFGEVTWRATDRLNFIVGGRVSKVKLDYEQISRGIAVGYNVPRVTNSGIVTGIQKETPFTPKASVQFQIDPSNMVYGTVSKGFRAGGVNAPIPAATCGAALANLGLTAADIPKTFESDSVQSYEVGSKLRGFNNRLMVNASAYTIDWSNVQLAVGLPGCNNNYTGNGGKARSRGFDIEGQLRPVDFFTINFAVGYTNAKYVETVLGPKPLNGDARAIVNDGDALPVPPWTVSIGGEFDVPLGDGASGYLRGDYQYASAFRRTLGPGPAVYAPDIYPGNSADTLNLRIGARFDRLELSLFAQNLLDSRDPLQKSGGRSSCNALGQACGFNNPVYAIATFRPRTIGLQFTYRQ